MAFTLVERDTTIGDSTVLAGSFLLSNSNERRIYHFSADEVGAGTTSGTYVNLIHGPDIGLGSEIRGLELIELPITLGGTPLDAGTVLVTLNNDDGGVGDNSIPAQSEDVFYLTVTQTGQTTTVANATLLFRGADVGLSGTAEELQALALTETADVLVTPEDTSLVIDPDAGGGPRVHAADERDGDRQRGRHAHLHSVSRLVRVRQLPVRRGRRRRDGPSLLGAER